MLAAPLSKKQTSLLPEDQTHICNNVQKLFNVVILSVTHIQAPESVTVIEGDRRGITHIHPTFTIVCGTHTHTHTRQIAYICSSRRERGHTETYRINYLQCSNAASSFLVFSSSVAVGMVTLVEFKASASLRGSTFRLTRLIISRVLFHLVATSCVSASFFCLCAICCCSSSRAFAGLCLKCPTSFRHFANALSNGLLCRETVIARCTLCTTHGMCSKGSSLAAAIILRALSVVSETTFFFDVPLSGYFHKVLSNSISEVPLFCLHNSQSMGLKFPLWSEIMCCDPEVVLITE